MLQNHLEPYSLEWSLNDIGLEKIMDLHVFLSENLMFSKNQKG